MVNAASRESEFATVTILLIAAGLIALTSAVFWRAYDFEFVNFDDDVHVYENPYVTDGLTSTNLRWAFEIHGPSQWHPLAWISHQLDCHVFGLWPGGHHVTNVLLHVANVVILFVLLNGMTRSIWRSAFVAAVFAVHPLNVESVAWISERRNVLSLFFGLLTLVAYVQYVRDGGLRRYVWVLIAFSLALMSKPLIVTLPCVMLLLDVWPLYRWPGRSSAKRLAPASAGAHDSDRPVMWRTPWLLILEKTPMLLLSAGTSILTILCQEGVVVSSDQLSMNVRLLNTLAAYAIYIKKIVWPTDLSVFYPHPGFVYSDPVSELTFPAIVGGMLLIGVSAIAIWYRHRRPALLAGWLWFLGTLVPMIGLVQVGRQQLADRYVYLPLIGVLIAAAWSGPKVVKARWRPTIAVVAVVIVGLFSIAAWRQVSTWRDSVTLFERAIAVTERNAWAQNNLGIALHRRGNSMLALSHLGEAVQLDPQYGLARYNLGVVLHDLRRPQQSISQFEEAVRLLPSHVESRLRLGIARADIGELDKAIVQFERATELSPDNSDTHFNLGLALSRQGNGQRAIKEFRLAIESYPANVKAIYSLADALYESGDIAESEQFFTKAIEISPGFALAHLGLGKVHLQQGKRQLALRGIHEALRLNSDLLEAQSILQHETTQ